MNLLSALTNNIDNTDSYKVSHWSQYPADIEYVTSYIEARKSAFAKQLGDDKYAFAEFFGLQAYLKDYLSKPIRQVDIDLAEIMYEMHGETFNKKGWQYILDHHNGYLPVEISAIPEGTVLPVGNALVQVVNTDPNCAWITSYVETALLRAVWYPTTVATKSRILKELIRAELEDCSENPDAALQFILHDFGARGNNTTEGSAIGGMSHIVNFLGTDTVMGLKASYAYYDRDFDAFLKETPEDPQMALLKTLKKAKAAGVMLNALSVEASEHSTMTIKGEAGEKDQIKMLIDRAKTGKIVSIVSDSYDYFDRLANSYGRDFKTDIEEAGKNGGRVVIRPDSGDPVEVVCRSLEILEEKFGCTTVKGYKLLPPYIRVLQGDGIDLDSVRDILKAVKAKGYSIENVIFGMGGGLEQKVNRDDLGFAQKACAAKAKDADWHDVYKDPKTGGLSFSKRSKRGVLSTVWDGVAFITKRRSDLKAGENDLLQPVYRNGKILKQTTFAEVRKVAEYFSSLIRKKPAIKIADPYAKAMTV